MLYSNTSSQMCNLILLIKCLNFDTAKTFVGILASCLFILIYSTLISPLVVSDWTQYHEYIFIPYLFPIFPYLLLCPHPCLCYYIYVNTAINLFFKQEIKHKISNFFQKINIFEYSFFLRKSKLIVLITRPSIL